MDLCSSCRFDAGPSGLCRICELESYKDSDCATLWMLTELAVRRFIMAWGNALFWLTVATIVSFLLARVAAWASVGFVLRGA